MSKYIIKRGLSGSSSVLLSDGTDSPSMRLGHPISRLKLLDVPCNRRNRLHLKGRREHDRHRHVRRRDDHNDDTVSRLATPEETLVGACRNIVSSFPASSSQLDEVEVYPLSKVNSRFCQTNIDEFIGTKSRRWPLRSKALSSQSEP